MMKTAELRFCGVDRMTVCLVKSSSMLLLFIVALVIGALCLATGTLHELDWLIDVSNGS